MIMRTRSVNPETKPSSRETRRRGKRSFAGFWKRNRESLEESCTMPFRPKPLRRYIEVSVPIWCFLTYSFQFSRKASTSSTVNEMSEEGVRCTQIENPKDACEILLTEIQSLPSNLTDKSVISVRDDLVEIAKCSPNVNHSLRHWSSLPPGRGVR